MEWQLTEIRSRVRDLTGLKAEQMLSQTEIDKQINNYYQNHLPELISPTELRKFFTITTSNGTGEYGVDNDMRVVYPPVWIDNEKGEFTRDTTYFFNKHGDRYDHVYQRPRVALEFDRTLWLAPIPDGEYTLKVIALSRPDELVNDTDTPMDQRWGEAIAAGAAIQILWSSGRNDEAMEVNSILQYNLNTIRSKNVLNFHGMRPAPRF